MDAKDVLALGLGVTPPPSSQRSSRMINCVVTRRLPVWDPVSGWSAMQPTRSITWAFADACRAGG